MTYRNDNLDSEQNFNEDLTENIDETRHSHSHSHSHSHHKEMFCPMMYCCPMMHQYQMTPYNLPTQMMPEYMEHKCDKKYRDDDDDTDYDIDDEFRQQHQPYYHQQPYYHHRPQQPYFPYFPYFYYYPHYQHHRPPYHRPPYHQPRPWWMNY